MILNTEVQQKLIHSDQTDVWMDRHRVIGANILP